MDGRFVAVLLYQHVGGTVDIDFKGGRIFPAKGRFYRRSTLLP
jgi:hypothetical protein